MNGWVIAGAAVCVLLLVARPTRGSGRPLGDPDPPNPHWLHGGEAGCPVRMRSPQAISCYWPCQLDDLHDGLHVWDGGYTHVEFTTEQAIRSWSGPYGIVDPEYTRSDR